MTWRQCSVILALGPLLAACDKIPFLGKGAETDTTAAATAAAAADTTQPTPAVAARTAPPAPVDRPSRVVNRQLVDEPWTPVDTGTLNPGMTREDVIATWGPPVAESEADGRGYLYFRNGCEVTCGTFDVVFLEQGGVVDVIARGPGHTYSGTSSSPSPGLRVPAPTLPATLAVPAADTTGAGTR